MICYHFFASAKNPSRIVNIYSASLVTVTVLSDIQMWVSAIPVNHAPVLITMLFNTRQTCLTLPYTASTSLFKHIEIKRTQSNERLDS